MTGPKFDQPPADPAGVRSTGGDSFCDLERVDEVRLYPIANPAPVPLEPGDLPSSYGRNRLVLLPVDPYMIHVYWDLSSAVPPSAGLRPILRFHESPASANAHQSRSFDVEIDFSTTSWYVHLWSPDKLYCADLGWRGEDGSFIEMARSNTVRTPPAWPRPAEPIPPREPEPRPQTVAEPPGPDAAPVDAATVNLTSLGATPGSPREIVAEPVPVEPTRSSAVPQRADAAALLQRRLAQLFAIRGELPPVHESVDGDLEIPFEAGEEIPGEPSQLDTPTPPPWSSFQELDLTQLSEERFTPGVSSERKGSFGE